MDCRISHSADKLILSLSGRLTYRDAESFPGLLAQIRQAKKEVEFDFQALDLIDSTGMGLLLQAYDIAQEKSLSMRITHPSASVSKILRNACFDVIITL